MAGSKRNINNNTQLIGNLLARRNLFNKMGNQYGGKRDIYSALGYPKDLTYDDFLSRYIRQDIAAAIIDRPTSATWRGNVCIKAKEEGVTGIETVFTLLNKKHSLKDCFLRADKLSCIGQYSILYLGFSDVQTKEQAQGEVTGKVSLAYVKPFGQSNAFIYKYETNPTSSRFGKPLLYKLILSSIGGSTSELIVHHSRCIHITHDLLENEVYGTPQLEKVFNRLMDIEKLVGGSAEMFWRGARPGMQSKVDKDYELSSDTDEKLQVQLQEFENDLRRLFTVEGIELETLTSQVSDPSNHLDIQMQMISAVTGIPKRILTGSERGELSSTQDRSEWFDLIQARREEFAEMKILIPFILLLQKVKVLEEGEFIIEWQDLYAPSEKEKMDVAKIKMETLKAYSESPVFNLISFPSFLSTFLKMDDIVIEKILQAQEEELNEEEKFNEETKGLDV